jgi:hypothetical protein
MKFLHFSDNTKKANYEGPAKLYKIFPVLSHLKYNGTDCVGTMKISRKNVPKKVKDAKLNQGEIIAQHCGPITVMKWRDKRNVVMISAYHYAEMKSVTKRGKGRQKPACISEYNKWLGGVDLKDQLLQMYLAERKHLHKWYLKLFRRLLNATVLNAMIIYRHNTGKQIDQLAFRVNLVEALFHQFVDTERKVPGRRVGDNTIP